MALSNTQIQKARPGEKSYRLYDEKGLYLEVAKSGGLPSAPTPPSV